MQSSLARPGLATPMGAALLAAAVLAAGCSAPEVRAATAYLECVADRDLKCLRRLSAPMLPRLQAWSVAYRADPLFIGAYARRVMQDADNPFGALSPGACAQAALAGPLPEAARLGDCACRVTSRRALSPAEERDRAFAPHQQRALRTHQAMEVLANRSAAEARRVSALSTVACSCRDQSLELGVLDLQGRDPVHRVFHVGGLCPHSTPLAHVVERAARLLSGELTPGDDAAPRSPSPAPAAPTAPSSPPP